MPTTAPRPPAASLVPFLLAVGLLMLLAPAARAESFTGVADTYVRSDRPDTNYGRSTQLRIDGSPSRGATFAFGWTGSRRR